MIEGKEKFIETKYELFNMKLVLTQDLPEYINGEVVRRTKMRHPETGKILPFPNPEYGTMNIAEVPETIDLATVPHIGAREVLLKCSDGYIYISYAIANRTGTLKNLLEDVGYKGEPIELIKCDVESLTELAKFYLGGYRLPDDECEPDGIHRPKLSGKTSEPIGNTNPLMRINLTDEMIAKRNVEYETEFYDSIIEKARNVGEKFAIYRYSQTDKYGNAGEYLEATDFVKLCQYVIYQFQRLIGKCNDEKQFVLGLEEMQIAINKDEMYDAAEYERLKKAYIWPE